MKIAMPLTAAMAFEAFRLGHLSPNCLRGVVGYTGYFNPNDSTDIVAAVLGKAQLFSISQSILCAFTVTVEVPILPEGASSHLVGQEDYATMI